MMKNAFYLYLMLLITYVALYPEEYGTWHNRVDGAYFEDFNPDYME